MLAFYYIHRKRVQQFADASHGPGTSLPPENGPRGDLLGSAVPSTVPLPENTQTMVYAPPRESASRIDRLLASPLTEAERAELFAGPRIELAPGFPAEHADRARAFVTSALRAALAIRFDAPMPVTNVSRVWDYLVAHVRRIEVHFPDERGFVNGSADSRTMTVVVNGHDVALWDPARWSTTFTPEGGLAAIGVGWMVPLLMHEAGHFATGLGHRCNTDCTACGTELYIRSNPLPGGGAVKDPSLAYGGADAVDHYTYLWLADHSGDWLSEAQRTEMRTRGERIRDSFCDRRAPQMYRMPGETA